MVAREGLEPPPPAFSGAAFGGGIDGSVHAAFELLRGKAITSLALCAFVLPRQILCHPLPSTASEKLQIDHRSLDWTQLSNLPAPARNALPSLELKHFIWFQMRPPRRGFRENPLE